MYERTCTVAELGDGSSPQNPLSSTFVVLVYADGVSVTSATVLSGMDSLVVTQPRSDTGLSPKHGEEVWILVELRG